MNKEQNEQILAQLSEALTNKDSALLDDLYLLVAG